MRQLSFKRHRFPPDIIRHSIWLYARFTLSFRDVEEMLAERGLDISYETIRRWFLKFGTVIAANLRRTRSRPSDHWHLDEMAIVIRRKRCWLWRGRCHINWAGWKMSSVLGPVYIHRVQSTVATRFIMAA